MAVAGGGVVGGDALDGDPFFFGAALVVFRKKAGEALVHFFDIGVGEDWLAGGEGIFVGLAQAFFTFVKGDFRFGGFGIFEGGESGEDLLDCFLLFLQFFDVFDFFAFEIAEEIFGVKGLIMGDAIFFDCGKEAFLV